MAEFKKSSAFIIILSVIFSNIAFAQYSDPSQYEGRPIDQSREGIDYYREGNVIVYPGKSTQGPGMGSYESLSEDELRSMAKAKMGERFSEEEFQKMTASKRKSEERKEAFSYEHEGYENRYYEGPSYEGFSKEQIIFGMVFEYIGDDVDPREIKQYCNDPEKMAEIVIAKFNEKTSKDSVCNRFEEKESNCEEDAKKTCEQMGKPYVREGASEMEKINALAYSCPMNKEKIIEACKMRSELYTKQRLQEMGKECEERFNFEGEKRLKECEQFRQNAVCDREKYMSQCPSPASVEERKESSESRDKLFMNARWECYDGTVESHTESSCKSHSYWAESARKSCDGRCSKETGKCGVNIISVSGECGAEKPACPQYPIPQCDGNAMLKSKADANGCVYYYCETQAVCPKYPVPDCGQGSIVREKRDSSNCVYYYCEAQLRECTKEAKICPDGSGVSRNPARNCEFDLCPSVACKKPICDGVYDTGQIDANGCHIFKCPPTACTRPVCEGAYDTGRKDSNGCPVFECPALTCPASPIPQCASGSTLEKRTDEKGCVYYYCSAQTCPEVSKPACASNEKLETSYDTKGCITAHKCVAACPEPTKPACSESQTIAARYDNNGCTYYECITQTSTTNNSVTGAVAGNEFDNKRRCEENWMQQKKACENMPKDCTKEAILENCRKTVERYSGEFDTEKSCHALVEPELKAAADKCSRMEQEKEKCRQHNIKRCSQTAGLAEQCRSLLTEENLRKFIIEEAKKRCKFGDMLEDENDIKKADKAEIILAVLNTATSGDLEKLGLFVDDLKEELKLQDTIVYKGMISPKNFGDVKSLPFVVNAKISSTASSEKSKETKEKLVAGQKAEDTASKLVSLRDSGVPKEYLYIIEDKASDVLNVSESLNDIEKKEEGKGFGYKVRLFFGLAKKAEQDEIKQLDGSKAKLQSSIDALEKLVDEVPSDVAKSIIKEQVGNLKKQKEDIDSLIKSKEKKSKGFWGIFG